MQRSTHGDNPCILVTGATGFAGCHLVEALKARGERVVGVSRRAAWPTGWKGTLDSVALLACDLCDGVALEAILREVKPGRIFHLAGYAAVGRSFQDPDGAWEGNLTSTRRLCEAIARWGERPRLLWVGSGLVYGTPEAPGPLNEHFPLRPDTPYAASKAAADLTAFQFTCNPGLDIVRARPFNHIGPHQAADFALANFARQLVAIERRRQPAILETGNLTTQRDLTDVRDTVGAYLLLMESGRRGEAYNVGCGQSYSMQTVLDRMLSLTGLDVELRQRADLLRPTDQAIIRVDADKLRRETGWVPRYTLDQTLKDILTYWRQQP